MSAGEETGFDYQSMLIRYLNIIGYEEGVDFLYPGPPWTDAEYAEMKRLADVADNVYLSEQN